MWTNRPRNQPLGWWLKIKSCISTAFAQIYQKFSTTHKPFSHTWAQCIFMLCGIFEDGVCEMYVEIILIRLTQFLLPPSPHAPLNRLSLPSDGALYLQFKYIDVQRQVFRHSVFSYQQVKCFFLRILFQLIPTCSWFINSLSSVHWTTKKALRVTLKSLSSILGMSLMSIPTFTTVRVSLGRSNLE